MIDCYLISTPYMECLYPTASLALLKAVGAQHGYNIKTKCVADELLTECNRDRSIALKMCEPVDNTQPIHILDIEDTEVGRFIDRKLDQIIAENPASIAISSFSSVNNISTIYMCYKLHLKGYTGKVIIGGLGLREELYHVDELGLDILIPHNTTGELLFNAGLIDHYVIGDGEEALIEWLSGNNIEPSNNIIEIRDFNIPYSNFDDFDLSNYDMLPITGSKSCVRNCTYCDVPGMFKRFKYRDGNNITNEIKHLNDKYNINKFYFTDSLINGSMKAFTDFITSLAKLNETRDIKWTGHYIIRPEHQIPPGTHQLMASSGAEGLTVGLESGSDNVLQAMKKNFVIQDFWTELDQFRAHKISMGILLLPCYYTETEQDFFKTIEAVRDMQPYVADSTIVFISGGHILQFTKNVITPLRDIAKNDGVRISDFRPDVWINPALPELNYRERMKRWLTLYKVIFDLTGKSPFNSTVDISFNKAAGVYNTFKDDIIEFENNIVSSEWNINEQVMLYDPSHEVDLILNGTESNGYPYAVVKLDQTVLYDDFVQGEVHILKYVDIPNNSKSALTIEVSKIDPHDTIMLDTEIIQDKTLEIKHISINKFKIMNTDLFYNSEYITPSNVYQSADICGLNGVWRMTWMNPFLNDLMKIKPVEFTDKINPMLDDLRLRSTIR